MAETQVVLITGTSRGIGRHLAGHFLAKGCQVAGCSRGPAPEFESNYTHYLADITDEFAVSAMMREVVRQHGQIDVIINNAGIASLNLALTTPAATVERMLATNFVGSFLVAREGAKQMLRHRYGRIINLSTVAVPLRIQGESIYAASKSAVETFTRILAKELAPFGITCNAVGPGPIQTDLIAGVPAAKLKQLVDQLPIGRFCTPADVANAVDFFARPESDAITGQVLYLGGA